MHLFYNRQYRLMKNEMVVAAEAEIQKLDEKNLIMSFDLIFMLFTEETQLCKDEADVYFF